MSVLGVKEFFKNKVRIQLKSGQSFEGLLCSVNYKDQVVVLEDVEDLGNESVKEFIPHDKKIAEKAFEADVISQIFFKEKHFSEPKKYRKDDFYDNTTPAEQNPAPRKYQGKYEQNDRGYNQERRGGYRERQERRPYKPRVYEQKREERGNGERKDRRGKPEEDRDYR